MNFDEWYEQNAKYMNTTDFEAWMLEAWEAGEKAEREACAKVCESFKAKMDAGLDHVAAAIRERSANARARGENGTA